MCAFLCNMPTCLTDSGILTHSWSSLAVTVACVCTTGNFRFSTWRLNDISASVGVVVTQCGVAAARGHTCVAEIVMHFHGHVVLALMEALMALERETPVTVVDGEDAILHRR